MKLLFPLFKNFKYIGLFAVSSSDKYEYAINMGFGGFDNIRLIPELIYNFRDPISESEFGR